MRTSEPPFRTEKDPPLIRIASSKNTRCIEALLCSLETQYPKLTFDLHSGRTCILSIVDNDAYKKLFVQMNWITETITYCEGYTSGWETARDAGSSEDYYE